MRELLQKEFTKNNLKLELDKILNEAKTIAEKANKEKAEFLENMSHEMRNPLQSILGVSQLIAKNNPRTDQKNFIHVF